jgi:DNA-binding response OmpR family regulator
MNSLLIVDDEEAIRLSFRIALETGELEILEASGGREALGILAKRKTNLILLDFCMPGMNGLEFLSQLRARNDNTPAILITAYGTVHNAVQAMKLGAIDVLEKPVKPDQLRKAVAEVLARHRIPDGNESDLSVDQKIQLAKKLINERRFSEAKRKLYEMFDCTKPEFHNLLGLLAEMEGDLILARSRYSAALVFDAAYSPAIENLKRLEALGVPSSRKNNDNDRGNYDLLFS